MTNYKFIVPLTRDEENEDIFDKFSSVAGICDEVPWLIKKLGWIALPIESSDHLSSQERENLLTVLLERKDEEIVAIALEDLVGFPSAFRVPATVEGLEEFNRYCGHFWFALYAGDPNWIIICTKAEYLILAGEEGFVNKFLGHRIDEIFAEFYNFCLAEGLSKDFRNRLLAVHNKLLYVYPKAVPGEIVTMSA